jgi:hypothetical protein
MFRAVAGFELRYQLKSPIFWITSLVFFALTFSATTSDLLRLGWGGQVARNSPFALHQRERAVDGTATRAKRPAYADRRRNRLCWRGSPP